MNRAVENANPDVSSWDDMSRLRVLSSESEFSPGLVDRTDHRGCRSRVGDYVEASIEGRGKAEGFASKF